MSDENPMYSGTLLADIVWKIENFSYFKRFNSFKSEEFFAFVESNLSFQLICEESTICDQDRIVSLKILEPNKNNRPAQTQIRYELFLLDNAGLIKKKEATTFFDYVRTLLIKGIRIHESEFENVVNIRCRIYWAQSRKTQVSRYYFQTFDWCIDDFLKGSGKEYTREVHLEPLTESKKSFNLMLGYRGNENRLTLTSKGADVFYISKYIIMIPMTDKCFLNHNNPSKVLFKEGKVLELQPLISRQEIINNYLYNGNLILNCKLLISDAKLNLQDEPSASTSENIQIGSRRLKNEQHRTSEENVFNNVRLTAEILKMYQEGLMSDFTVKVGPREFPTHMCVLSARSPVIRRMLENDMKEKQEKTLIIPNMEEDTVHRMLDYIYTDNPGELDFDSASKLYSAANMYEIAGLKHDCKVFLKQNISISNVCEVLLLGELHGDQELKSSAICFIYEHEEEVVLCKEFEAFSKDNPQLSVEVLLGVARLRMKKS